MWRKAHEFKVALIVVGVALAVGVAFYIRWRLKKHKTFGDVVVEKAEQAAANSPPAPK